MPFLLRPPQDVTPSLTSARALYVRPWLCCAGWWGAACTLAPVPVCAPCFSPWAFSHKIQLLRFCPWTMSQMAYNWHS